MINIKGMFNYERIEYLKSKGYEHIRSCIGYTCPSCKSLSCRDWWRESDEHTICLQCGHEWELEWVGKKEEKKVDKPSEYAAKLIGQESSEFYRCQGILEDSIKLLQRGDNKQLADTIEIINKRLKEMLAHTFFLTYKDLIIAALRHYAECVESKRGDGK